MHKEDEIKNVISLEEYIKRQRGCRRENKSESETYSFEFASDSFLESLIKIVNP